MSREDYFSSNGYSHYNYDMMYDNEAFYTQNFSTYDIMYNDKCKKKNYSIITNNIKQINQLELIQEYLSTLMNTKADDIIEKVSNLIFQQLQDNISLTIIEAIQQTLQFEPISEEEIDIITQN